MLERHLRGCIVVVGTIVAIGPMSIDMTSAGRQFFTCFLRLVCCVQRLHGRV